MQCKDISDGPILQFLGMLERKEVVSCWEHFGKLETYRMQWATAHPGFANSVLNAMPAGTPTALARAKMQRLIDRGLVSGCTCGCRGDFELTGKGRELTETEEKEK
jgi:hypothetical protein